MSNDYFRALLLAGVVLVPLLPTVVIYRYLKTTNTARVRGTILGLHIETAGAIASYLACVLIAITAYKLVFRGPDTSQIQVVVALSGDPERIDHLLSDADKKSRLILSKSESPTDEIRVDHFDADLNRRVLTTQFTVSVGLLNSEYTPTFSYAAQALTVSDKTVRLSETLTIRVDLGGQSGDQWVAAADLFSYTFRNAGSDLFIREVMCLHHDSMVPLQLIPLHSYLDLGQLVYIEVGARAVEKETCDQFGQEWVGSGARDLSPEVLQQQYEQRYAEVKTKGDEIAIRHFTNSNYKLPGQGQRFQRGHMLFDDQRVVPTIGPIDGGIDRSKGVLIYVESWRKIDAETRQPGREIGTGETFERPTDHVLFMVSSDKNRLLDTSSARSAYKENLLTSVSNLGGAHVRKGSSALSLDLTPVKAGDVVQLYWTWK